MTHKKMTLIASLVFTLILTSCTHVKMLSLDEYKSKLREAQRLIDEEDDPIKALSEFKLLRRKLREDAETKKYIAGLEISTLWAMKEAKSKDIEKQVTKIINLPAQEFIAIEKYKVEKDIGWEYWFIGNTHAQVESEFLLPAKREKATSSLKEAKLLAEYAVKYQTLSYSRVESSWGENYGESEIATIYYDIKMPGQEKLSFLKGLRNRLNGPVRMNLEYCIGLLSEKLGNIEEALEAYKLSLKFNKEQSYHQEQMAELAEKRITAIKLISQ